MFPVLLFLFIAVPIIEIALFIQVGSFLGVWVTVGLVLLTAMVGASLVRSQGIQTLMNVQSRINQGELPAQQLIEGVLLAVAGILLLTPGFMTDIMGMVVLLPMPRAKIAQYLMSKVVVKANGSSNFSFYQKNEFDQTSNHGGNTYDGEFERKNKNDDHDKLN